MFVYIRLEKIISRILLPLLYIALFFFCKHLKQIVDILCLLFEQKVVSHLILCWYYDKIKKNYGCETVKKAVCLLICAVIAFVSLSGCSQSAVKTGAKTKDGDIMIESFDNVDFTAESYTSAEVTSKNAKRGKALRVKSNRPFGNDGNVGAKVIIKLAEPINADEYRYFKLCLYSETELTTGHLDIGLLKSADNEDGYNYRRHCNLKQGYNEIYFSKTELVCAFRLNADLTDINAICLKWINDDGVNDGCDLYFDSLLGVKDENMTAENYDCTLTLEEDKQYKVKEYRRIMSLQTPDERYGNLQGGYYDGSQFVVCITKGSMRQGNESGIIAKYDNSGKLLQMSDDLRIEHGNNISFVPKLNSYIVSHCQPGWNLYSFVNADTLKETTNGGLDRNAFSIAYSPAADKYASGFSAGEMVHTWNGDLELIDEFNVEKPASLSQGAFCDSKYIYFVRSFNGPGTWSEIRIYRWDGTLAFQIDLDEWDSWDMEPESINIVDGHIYIMGEDEEFAVYEIILEEKG